MLSTKKDFSTPLCFARNDKSKQIIKLNKINKKMKKLSTLLIIAFALVLGLTQCKKKVDTIATPSDLGKTVYITVNVGDGDRHIVYPPTSISTSSAALKSLRLRLPHRTRLASPTRAASFLCSHSEDRRAHTPQALPPTAARCSTSAVS